MRILKDVEPSVDDEPLDDFYPVCIVCGEKITGDGYKIGDDYCCDECAKSIDGTDEAINNPVRGSQRKLTNI